MESLKYTVFGICLFNLICMNKVVTSQNENFGIDLCDKGWFKLTDTKCILVSNDEMSQKSGSSICRDKKGELLTFDNEDEETSLSNFVSNNKIEAEVWLGYANLVKNGANTTLENGTVIKYANWNANQPDGHFPCISMSLKKTNVGKWTGHQGGECSGDVFYKAICKKDLKIDDTNVIRTISILVDKLIPIGYIYTQYPKTNPPKVLWPDLKFKDVTTDYAGLFFRAFGKESGEFSDNSIITQDSDLPKILRIRAHSAHILKPEITYDTYRPYQEESFNHTNNNDNNIKNTTYDIHPKNGSIYQMMFDMSLAENRPKNSAIKIWKRIA